MVSDARNFLVRLIDSDTDKLNFFTSLSSYYHGDSNEKARNSWGTGWGENGFVKMARVGGSKGRPGVCGIARSPSVALGGSFKKGVKLNTIGAYGSMDTVPRGGDSRDGIFHTESTIERTVAQIQSALQ